MEYGQYAFSYGELLPEGIIEISSLQVGPPPWLTQPGASPYLASHLCATLGCPLVTWPLASHNTLSNELKNDEECVSIDVSGINVIL